MTKRTPVRYTSGISSYPPRHILNSYPAVLTPRTINFRDTFLPYQSGAYTATAGFGGTLSNFNALGGVAKFLTTNNVGIDSIYIGRLGAGFQHLPGNQAWCDTQVAYPRTVLNANDTNIYWGLFDNVVPTAAANGIYFVKPTGGTAVHFVIKKGGVTTTFQNIGDLAVPSGLYGDTNAVNAVLNAVVVGNALTGVSVVTPGAGYQNSPLILTTAASGSAGLDLVSAELGSTSYSSANPSQPIAIRDIPYGSIYAPMITSAGSGLTNSAGATTYLEVIPFLNFAFWYDGGGFIHVGVNGREVMSLGGNATGTGVTGVAAGATVNVATQTQGASFFSTTQLTTAVSPVQPAAGSASNLLPLVPLGYDIGIANTTANARSFYVAEYSIAETHN